MKNPVLNRRSLLSLAIAGGSTVAMAGVPGSILSQLEANGAEERIASIVGKYFPIPEGQEAFLGTFYRSLMHGDVHHQDKAYLNKHLADAELESALEVYVIEAFASSTNYLKVSAGEELKLRMLKV